MREVMTWGVVTVTPVTELLRERVAGPEPADGASRDEYDFGFVPPPTPDS